MDEEDKTKFSHVQNLLGMASWFGYVTPTLNFNTWVVGGLGTLATSSYNNNYY